jgi:hypothetical protein
MYCPNCGTANENTVTFCANCGTLLHAAPNPTPLQPEVVPPYSPTAPPQTRDGFLKYLGIGCLVVLAVFVLFGLSCARACLFRRRRYSRF